MAPDRPRPGRVTGTAGAPERWPVAATPLVLAVAILLLYRDSFAWLVSEWSTSNARFSHGFLLAAIALFLLVRSGRQLDLQSISPSWWTLPVVFVASFVWLLGDAGNVAVVQSLMLPVLALASVCTVLGHSAARQLAFAILYIVFALPAWEYVQFIFQAITVAVVTSLLQLIEMPAVIESNVVHLGAGSFRIASGCSGVTYLIVGLALAALYGHLYYRSTRLTWLLIAIAFAFSLIVNWVRVTAIIVIGHTTRMQSSIVDDHHAFGWVLFGIALIPLFVIARNLEPGDHPSSRPQPPVGPAASPGSVMAAGVAVLALLSVGPVWSVILAAERSGSGELQLSLPGALRDWRGPVPVVSDWRPVFHGVSAEASAVYTSGQGPVYLYHGVYADQVQDRELVYLHNRVQGELAVDGGPDGTVELGDLQVRRLTAHDGFSQWRIWYWYEIDGRRVASDAMAKTREAVAAVRGRHYSGVFAVAARCDRDCASVETQLRRFLDAAGKELWLDRMVTRPKDGG